MLRFNFLSEVSKGNICKKTKLTTLELSWVYNNKQTNKHPTLKKKEKKKPEAKRVVVQSILGILMGQKLPL